MAELIPDDIYENIFLRLDVRNLISCKSVCKSWKSLISESHFIKAHFRWYNIFLRLDVRIIECKSVCKSWKSLISDSLFIKAHLNRSYTSNQNGHKRIGEAVFLNTSNRYSMIGSSNGLVCILECGELLVTNPLTSEVKPVPQTFARNTWEFYYEVVCGFGYDSLRDDYKVICGVIKGKDQTSFKVFSLKSNAWNVIGEVNYTYDSDEPRVGVLCNGAMHWIMHPKNQKTKKVILSFDLSTEEFKEISQPDYQIENRKYLCISLGIMEECLCIHDSRKVWVMKKYNEKQSWEVVDNCQIKAEYPFCYTFGFKVRNDTFTGHLSFNSNIMESLVSPHLQPDNE
ncbi:putative F-box domain-containing protein [Tanacetum coccineum]